MANVGVSRGELHETEQRNQPTEELHDDPRVRRAPHQGHVELWYQWSLGSHQISAIRSVVLTWIGEDIYRESVVAPGTLIERLASCIKGRHQRNRGQG